MLDPHTVFDGVQSFGIVVASLGWIYSRLHKADKTSESQAETSRRLTHLEESMTLAMTRMAEQVSSLAQSIAKVEGQLIVMREAVRR